MFKKLKPLKFGVILIISIFLTFGFSVSLQSLLAAWTAPSANPPTNNIADLNLGGGLSVATNALVMGNFAASNTKMALFADTTIGNVGIGTVSPNLRLHVDTGNTSNGALLLTKSPGTPAFSILPWSSQVYISAGIYYKNGTWIQQSDTNDNQLLALDPGSGALWYASNNGTPSWNIASGKKLWDSSGIWKSGVNTTDNVTATDVCTVSGKCLSTVGGSGGFQTFTSNGTFTVPAGVAKVFVNILSGGGGGGGGSSTQTPTGGGGGAAGNERTGFYCPVVSGQSLAVVVGAGGAGGNGGIGNWSENPGANGANGGQSSFGACIVLKGGNGGKGGSIGQIGYGGTFLNLSSNSGAGGGANSTSAGSPGGNSLMYNGGSGGAAAPAGWASGGGGGGGGASYLANGGNGGAALQWGSCSGSAGVAGRIGGAGGGGGGASSGGTCGTGTGGKGGAGGAGRVVVYW